MAFTVENNVSFDPADVSLLGARAVMFQAELITHLIKQFGRRGSGFIWLIRMIGHNQSYWTKDLYES